MDFSSFRGVHQRRPYSPLRLGLYRVLITLIRTFSISLVNVVVTLWSIPLFEVFICGSDDPEKVSVSIELAPFTHADSFFFERAGKTFTAQSMHATFSRDSERGPF